MRDGSLAKNKPPSACRDVNHVTLLIRNCSIVLKSDLKRSADSELMDSFMEFSTISLCTMQFFFFLKKIAFLFFLKKRKKEKTGAASAISHMVLFSRKGDAVDCRDE